jgi:hypothetical protein
MGLLARILGSSGLTHGRAPYSFHLSPGDLVPMEPNLISDYHQEEYNQKINNNSPLEGDYHY